jgi:hypothetical protein
MSPQIEIDWQELMAAALIPPPERLADDESVRELSREHLTVIAAPPERAAALAS